MTLEQIGKWIMSDGGEKQHRWAVDQAEIDYKKAAIKDAQDREANRRTQELYQNGIAADKLKKADVDETNTALQEGKIEPGSAPDTPLPGSTLPPGLDSINAAPAPAPTQANILTPTGPQGKPLMSAKDVLAKALASVVPPTPAPAMGIPTPISQPVPAPQGAPRLPGAPALLPQSTITPEGSGVSAPAPGVPALSPMPAPPTPQAPTPDMARVAPPAGADPIAQMLSAYAAKKNPAINTALAQASAGRDANPPSIGTHPAQTFDSAGNRYLSHDELTKNKREEEGRLVLTPEGLQSIYGPTMRVSNAPVSHQEIAAMIKGENPGEVKAPNLYEVRARTWISEHPAEAKTINTSKPLFNQLPVKAQQEVVDAVQSGAAENKVTELQRQRLDLQDKRTDAFLRNSANTNQILLANLQTLSNQQGGESVANNVATVLANPDAYDKLDVKSKAAVNANWTKTTGLPLPAPLPMAAKTTEEAAKNTLVALNAMQKIANDYPDIIGPVMGRIAKGENVVGDQLYPRDKARAAAAAELFTRSVYVNGIESKAVLGGRPNQGFMHDLKDVSANPKQSKPFFDAAIKAAKFHGVNVLVNNEKERWGGSGAMRPSFDKHVDEYGGDGSFKEYQGSRTGEAAPPSSYKQTASGPGGHKIGSNDGGSTWFDVSTGKKI